MKTILFSVLTLWFLYLQIVTFTTSQTTTSSSPSQPPNLDEYFDPSWSICFEYTWMGPQYDNTSKYNGSCMDLLDDTRAKNVPCSDPLVITDNSNEPDMSWLWREKQRSVICRRSNTQVCAKYTYRYNGHIENATYMCTKVTSVTEHSALESGCYKQNMQGYEVEICVCKSGPGLYFPCNSALISTPILIITILTSISIIFL